MTDITLLLVPSADDTEGLLAPGLCGASVPGMYSSEKKPCGWARCWANGGPRAQALVLAYRGEVAREGILRATQVLGKKWGLDGELMFGPFGVGWALFRSISEDPWAFPSGSVWFLPSGGHPAMTLPFDDSKGQIVSAPYLKETPNLIPTLLRAWMLARICAEELPQTRLAFFRGE